MRAPALTAALLGLSLAVSGCGKDSSSTSSGGKQHLAVKAGDTTCELSSKAFKAGDIELQVSNTGKDVTEVYVYGKDSGGRFDKVVGEAENIAPGTSSHFAVKVGGGEYEVACKPGQKGDGIRSEIEVSGQSAGASQAAYDREVEVTATDFAYQGLKGFTAKAGEKIEFKLENKGQSPHTLTFYDPAGKELGGVPQVAPGQTGEAVVTFAGAGTYTYKCEVDGHADKGMKGSLTVS